MHGSVDHLVGNMFMLFILGMACEHAFGHPGFLFLYVAACITGSLHDIGLRGAHRGSVGGDLRPCGSDHLDDLCAPQRIELRDHRVGIVLAIWSIYTLRAGRARARSSRTPATSAGCWADWCWRDAPPGNPRRDRRALSRRGVLGTRPWPRWPGRPGSFCQSWRHGARFGPTRTVAHGRSGLHPFALGRRVGQGEQAVGRDEVRVAFHEAVGRVDPAPVGVLALGQGGDQLGPPVVRLARGVGERRLAEQRPGPWRRCGSSSTGPAGPGRGSRRACSACVM